MHVLVEWPLHRQRLQQRKCLVGQPVGHQHTSEVPHQAGSDRVQPVAVRRRPVLIQVLGQQLTRPQRERIAKVLGCTRRESPHGRGVEVIDVDHHAAVATEDDDLIVENQVLSAHNPASRMQRLMEVVRTHRRVGLRPQLLDEDITMNPMASRSANSLTIVLAFRNRHRAASRRPRRPPRTRPTGQPSRPWARRSPTHAPRSHPRRQPQPIEPRRRRPPDAVDQRTPARDATSRSRPTNLTTCGSR